MSNMFLNVVSTFKGDGLTAATRSLGAFGKQTTSLGSSLGKIGASLAAFGVITKSVQFTRETIDSARDLERNLFSLNTIFDDLAPGMIQFTKDAEAIGLSQKDAAKASTFLGSVLKQSGFSMADVSTETQKLVTLGVDLAATYGYDVQEALLGMTALFRGEYDPIEKFGVAMKQSEINSELAARGQDKLAGAARRNAEQTIRLELLYQRAADATGAFSAQSGNLYVEQKKLSAQFENMQATVGAALLPAMGQLVQALKPLVDELTPRLIQVVTNAGPALQTLTTFLKDLGDKSSTTGQVVGGLADVLGFLFQAMALNFGTLIQLTVLIGGLRLAFILLSAAIAMTPLGWLMFGIGALSSVLLIGTTAARNYGIAMDNVNYVTSKYDVKPAIGKWDAYGIALQNVTSDTNTTRKSTNYMIAAVERADKAKLENLKAQIDGVKISAAAAAGELARMTRYALGDTGGGKNKNKDTSTTTTTGDGGGTKKERSFMQTLKFEAKKSKKAGKLIGAGLSEGLTEQILGRKNPLKAANKILNKIANSSGKFAKKIQGIYNKTKAGKAELAAIDARNLADQAALDEEAKAAADALLASQEEAARKEAEILAEKERVYNSFLDSVKQTFGSIRDSILGAFDITGLGNSSNSVIRNMGKLLEKTRGFASSISQLATMGLDPQLLQQIISAGPIAGAQLAASLVSGGVGALGQINAAYGEFGALASSIATSGTNAMFGTAAQQTIYNINVDGGVGSGSTIGKAIVDAIKAYERTSGAVWQGA